MKYLDNRIEVKVLYKQYDIYYSVLIAYYRTL